MANQGFLESKGTDTGRMLIATGVLSDGQGDIWHLRDFLAVLASYIKSQESFKWQIDIYVMIHACASEESKKAKLVDEVIVGFTNKTCSKNLTIQKVTDEKVKESIKENRDYYTCAAEVSTSLSAMRKLPPRLALVQTFFSEHGGQEHLDGKHPRFKEALGFDRLFNLGMGFYQTQYGIYVPSFAELLAKPVPAELEALAIEDHMIAGGYFKNKESHIALINFLKQLNLGKPWRYVALSASASFQEDIRRAALLSGDVVEVFFKTLSPDDVHYLVCKSKVFGTCGDKSVEEVVGAVMTEGSNKPLIFPEIRKLKRLFWYFARELMSHYGFNTLCKYSDHFIPPGDSCFKDMGENGFASYTIEPFSAMPTQEFEQLNAEWQRFCFKIEQNHNYGQQLKERLLPRFFAAANKAPQPEDKETYEELKADQYSKRSTDPDIYHYALTTTSRKVATVTPVFVAMGWALGLTGPTYALVLTTGAIGWACYSGKWRGGVAGTTSALESATPIAKSIFAGIIQSAKELTRGR